MDIFQTDDMQWEAGKSFAVVNHAQKCAVLYSLNGDIDIRYVLERLAGDQRAPLVDTDRPVLIDNMAEDPVEISACLIEPFAQMLAPLSASLRHEPAHHFYVAIPRFHTREYILQVRRRQTGLDHGRPTWLG